MPPTLPDRLALEHADAAASILAALADPVRLKIVLLLADRDPMNVRDFEYLIDRSQPTISHHIRKLDDAGFLARRPVPQSRLVDISLNRKAIATIGDLIAKVAKP